MGMAKKTGEKKKKGAGGLPNQKSKTDAGTGSRNCVEPKHLLKNSSDVGKRALEVAEQAREKKKQKKEQKLAKAKQEEEEERSSGSESEEEPGGREMPSVKSDKTLAGIAAKVGGFKR